MNAIKEYAIVKNRQIVLNLPESFDQTEVEVIVLQKNEKAERVTETSKKRPLGILKGKATCLVKDDFKMTEEEVLSA